MKILIAALCMLPVMSHARFELALEGVNDDQVVSLLKEAENQLPASFKDGINKKVTVKFADLNIKGKVILGHVMKNPLNKANSTVVNLNTTLLNDIKTGSNVDRAKRTLLHEISHVYDFQNKLVGHEKELLAICDQGTTNISTECRKLKNKKYSISDSALFLSIAGWQKKTISRRYGQSNTMLARRVDNYEDASPQEAFAVNMEFFLTDSEFKCRKPSMYSYLSKAFDHTPFSEKLCDIDYRLAPAVSPDGQAVTQKVIDPKRLYQVHYFFAGQGKNVMSRWGHSMIRLVMCSPDRKVMDEKCLQDRAHHLILSYRANVTNFKIDYIKGLTGKYASQMFVLPMVDVIKEYTVGELRDLYSLPLVMNERQKTLMINQVMERYWGYQSKYYFITNNCADETLNLLKNVYIDELKMVDLNVLTPLTLRKKFEKIGLIDSSIFKDMDYAKKAGFFFESLHPKLKRVFTDLNAAKVLNVDIENYEEFLNSSTIEERQELSKDIKDKALVGKLIFIEETILNRKILGFQQSIGKILEEEKSKENPGEFAVLFESLQKNKAERTGFDISRGYGIPQISDNIFDETDISNESDAELKALTDLFASTLKETFADEISEMEAIANNKKQLFEKILAK